MTLAAVSGHEIGVVTRSLPTKDGAMTPRHALAASGPTMPAIIGVQCGAELRRERQLVASRPPTRGRGRSSEASVGIGSIDRQLEPGSGPRGCRELETVALGGGTVGVDAKAVATVVNSWMFFQLMWKAAASMLRR